MKLHSKLTLITSLAALATSPLILANIDDAATAAPAVCAEPVEETVIDKDANLDADADKLEDIGADDSVVDSSNDGGATEPGEVTDPSDDGNAVPIDWVKRGGGDGDVSNPDVIFYTMTGGSPVLSKGEQAAVAKELGQDEKAVGVETKGNRGLSQINREKKGPVALLTKGRVFLR